MAKEKTIFGCTECGNTTPKWVGCCAQCGVWNSLVEHKTTTNSAHKRSSSQSHTPQTTKLFSLEEISLEHLPRMKSGIEEWDRVLGGGILPGSFMILTGDPGVGKSTLLLQIGHMLAAQSHATLYFSSEESMQQVKNRALRLEIGSTLMQFSDQTSLESIIGTALHVKPQVLILDSIQSCVIESETYSFPGTVGQLREAAFKLMRVAKENHIAIIITGHITKDGAMAGPKILEHMVDAVFYLQGDERFETRILRSAKNRFGTINELGFFQMQAAGMTQVSNINDHILTNVTTSPGSALICSLEGSRPLLVEVQALCVEAKFGNPQRVISGIDHKRVVLVAAILEKYLKVRLSAHDIFFKVTGGFTIKEAGSDLGIALALLSSYLQKPLPARSIAVGELSLTGHVKPLLMAEKQVFEAHKFGLETLIISDKTPLKNVAFKNVYKLRSVYDLVSLFPEGEHE